MIDCLIPKGTFCILLMLFLVSCGNAGTNKNVQITEAVGIDTAINQTTKAIADTLKIENATDSETATYFVVVADSGLNYYTLHEKMLALNNLKKIPIDTMGRFYNQTNNLIALPDDDEDEIYAGDYFPRRHPSINLSLEYLSFYQQNAGDKTIALVSGIFENKKSADSALAILHAVEKSAFVVKADIYLGCLH